MLQKLACPGCGASIDYIDGKEFFFCVYCGSKLAIDDDKTKLLDITEEITTRTDVPMIDCEYCGGTIFVNREKKYKCKDCGKTVCEICYYPEVNLCKSCILGIQKEQQDKEELKKRTASVINWIIKSFLLAVYIIFLLYINKIL